MKTLQNLWLQNNKVRLKMSARAALILAAIIIIFGLGFYACFHQPNVHHVYRIARDPTWYPLDVQGKEKNLLAFSNELLSAIANQEDIRIDLINSDSLVIGLDHGLFDGILSPLEPNPNNREKYLFSEPFFLLGPVLVVPFSSHITSLQQIKDKTIGVITASSLVFNTATFPSMLITSYDNPISALHDLESNIIDGVILDRFLAYAYTSGIYAGRLKIVSAPLSDKGLRLVARNQHQNEALINEFNAGLDAAKKSGLYDKLVAKWGLPG